MSKIKTFRGKLSTDKQDQIHLAGGDAVTGYKIKKFEAIASSPAGNSPEAVLKIYSVKQSAVDFVIDFEDDTLLAAMFYESNAGNNVLSDQTVIFDNDVFNQDIYVTCGSTDGDMNYYIELEEIKMKDSEIAVVNYKAALLHGE